MAWMQALPAIGSLAGGVAGGLLSKDRSNIDRSPGLQTQSKGVMYATYPELIRQIRSPMNITEDVGVDPLFSRGMEQVGAATEGMQPLISGAQEAFQTGIRAPDVSNNPYMQGILGSLAGQAGRYFTEEVNPALRRSAIQGGMYGGGRSGVNQAVAAGKVGQGLMDASRQALMQGYSQGLGHQANLLGMAPSMAGLGLLPGQALMQAGLQGQQARTQQMGSEIARRQGMTDILTRPMQAWSGTHAGMFGTGIPQSLPGTSGAATGAGLGMMAGGLLQNIFAPRPQTTVNTPTPQMGGGYNYGALDPGYLGLMRQYRGG